MGSIARQIIEPLNELPIAPRHALIGAAVLGTLGGIVGLVVGLHVYAPTAVVAILEVGMPAALAGGLLGLLSGSLVWTWRLAHDHRRR